MILEGFEKQKLQSLFDFFQHLDDSLQQHNNNFTPTTKPLDPLPDLHITHKLETPKMEDSSSNSLLEDDTSEESNKQTPYLIQPATLDTEKTNNRDHVTHVGGHDWFFCDICGETYEEENSFQAHFNTHFQKCDICFAMFSTTQINVHKREDHPDLPVVKVRESM